MKRWLALLLNLLGTAAFLSGLYYLTAQEASGDGAAANAWLTILVMLAALFVSALHLNRFLR